MVLFMMTAGIAYRLASPAEGKPVPAVTRQPETIPALGSSDCTGFPIGVVSFQLANKLVDLLVKGTHWSFPLRWLHPQKITEFINHVGMDISAEKFDCYYGSLFNRLYLHAHKV